LHLGTPGGKFLAGFSDLNEPAHAAERLRLALDSAEIGEWTWDTASDAVFLSPIACRIFGLPEGAKITWSTMRAEILNAADAMVAANAVRMALENKSAYRVEYRIRKADTGDEAWVFAQGRGCYNESGDAIGMIGLVQDVTDRRRAMQEALRESETQFKLLVGGVSDYALYMLDPNGIVTNWNIGAQRIKGYLAREIVGHHFSRFYTDPDRAAGIPHRALETAALHGKFEAEGWRVRKDGSVFWANVVIDAIRGEDGELLGFAKITRDISERREAQLAMARVQEQMAQSQKMEALGQLTGGVAHDFNNLLMVVGGQAQVLKQRLNEARDIRAVDAIIAASQRGAALTKQMLSFARRQRLQPVPTNLCDQISQFREMLESSIPGSIELAVDIPDDIWPVEVDIGELELALLNLTGNARDAMPGGGRLTLSAQNVHMPRREDNELAGDYVSVSLSDTGEGIPPEILTRIFDPFFTTKAVGQGTGLGLAQVYGFAQQSGGTVVAFSTVGKGTTISIYLPRTAARPAVVDTDEANAPPPRGEGERILVVEDNPDVGGASVAVLEQLGYSTTLVTDAQSALDRLAQESFDLVFSDIVMPGSMDGLMLGQEIQKRWPGLPVLLTTGYSAAAQSAGDLFPIIRKPYQVPVFARILKAMVIRPTARMTENTEV